VSTAALLRPEERRSSDTASSPLLAISNETVRLYKQAFGRGPTKARTLFADANTSLILLEDALTAGEQTLLDAGADAQFRESRRVIQGVLEPALRSVIERALGLETRALIAGIDATRATSAHVITLEPAAVVDASSVSVAAESAPR